jgi:hypothetical protein
MQYEHTELPAQFASLVRTAPLPQIYSEAKRAIAECERLDECAEWGDKAVALASYARQVDDFEMEICARRIRLRAVRRCGELLKEFDARGGDRGKPVIPLAFARRSRAAVASEAGLTEHKTRTAVNIADIPEADFEAAVESRRPPGTTLLALWKKQNQRDRFRSVTESSLAEVSKSAHAGYAVEGLLQFEKSAAECGLDVIVEILTRRGNAQKLARVRRGIGLVFRLNSALDEVGNRGNSMLRQVVTEKTPP